MKFSRVEGSWDPELRVAHIKEIKALDDLDEVFQTTLSEAMMDALRIKFLEQETTRVVDSWAEELCVEKLRKLGYSVTSNYTKIPW